MSALRKDTSEQGKEIINRVVKAQRAWIVLRDASCDVEGIEMLGGTGEGLLVGGCLGDMTRERVEYIIKLQKTLGAVSSVEEGDISFGK